jgi:hypothetical protein
LRAAIVALGLLSLVGGCGPDLGKPPAVCSTSAVSKGESPEMEPGGDCIGCHSSSDGPSFRVAGTVMNELRDDTNCGGLAGVTVRITGNDGKVVDLTTNSTGNFFLESRAGAIALPFKAEVRRDGKVRAMVAAQTNGSCNSCHTSTGLMLAPGRIVPP